MASIKELLALSVRHVPGIYKRLAVTISPTASIVAAASLMSEKKIGCLLVTDEPAADLKGGNFEIVTERDMLGKVGSDNVQPSASVREISTKSVRTVGIEKSVSDVLMGMIDNDIRHLPVLDGEIVVGIISIRDLARHLSSTDDGSEFLQGIADDHIDSKSGKVICVDPAAAIKYVTFLMNNTRTGSVLVGSRQSRHLPLTVEAIFTERDFLRGVAAGEDVDLFKTPVSGWMTREVIWGEAEGSLHDALRLMILKGIRHLPLRDASGTPRGILSMRDILRGIFYIHRKQLRST